MVLGFGLENSYTREVDQRLSSKEGDSDSKTIDVARGSAVGLLHRTFWMKLAFFLQFVAAVAAGLVFWVEKQRARGAPMPRIDVKW
jgi:hypothetical protein